MTLFYNTLADSESPSLLNFTINLDNRYDNHFYSEIYIWEMNAKGF